MPPHERQIELAAIDDRSDGCARAVDADGGTVPRMQD
jgi:hypothetical protein